MDSQVLIKYFWITLALVIFVIFFNRIDSFKSTEEDSFSAFKSDFYAKDVSLLVTRMVFSGADSINLDYIVDDPDYNIELEKNEIVVKYKGTILSKHKMIGDTNKILFEKTSQGFLIKKNE